MEEISGPVPTALEKYENAKITSHFGFVFEENPPGISHDNHKNYNFLACHWFKKVLFSTNSLAKLLSDSLLLDSLLLDSSISQSHSKI